MDILKNNLQYLGLTDEEIQLYINAIETQASTVLEFAQNTGIPRTTVYLLVDSLLQKELLTEEVVGKKKKFIPIPPTALIQLAKEKEALYKKTVTSLQNNLSQLQALYNLHSHKPNVQFYEGKDQVISVFEESLQAEKIYFYFMTEVFQAKLADYLDTFFEKIGKNMIQTYGMVASSLKRNIKQEHTSRNQVIIIPQEYTAQTDFLICDTKIAYIQVKEDTISALVIDDPHICFFEKTRYIMLWKLLSGQKL